MADSNQAGAADGSALSRSTSVTKSGRTTHQRKPSLNISSSQQQPPLYAVPEKPASTPTIDPANSMPSPKRLTRPSVWRSWLRQLDALFDSPAGPLLPHDKHSTVFGGTHKRSKLTALAKPRWVRFLILFYIVFSVFLSINHLWHFFTSPSLRLDSRFGENWKPQRTYDQDAPYSSLDSMTHGLKMSKLFSKAFYEAAGATRPYWLKGSQAVQENDVTVITTVTPETWPELERLAKYWHGMEEKKLDVLYRVANALCLKGPISATLHANVQEDLEKVKLDYLDHPELRVRADIHLIQSPGPAITVLLPRNAERNMARLFARSQYVCEMPSNVFPATDFRRTFETNREIFENLLLQGDMLVVPTFGFTKHETDTYTVPYHKARLLELVAEGKIGLLDHHWDLNEGPTDFTKWKEGTTLYAVENYDSHYEPIVIENKNVQPW